VIIAAYLPKALKNKGGLPYDVWQQGMKVAKQNRVALVSAANAIFNLEGGWT
jgi:hypothetical protein